MHLDNTETCLDFHSPERAGRPEEPPSSSRNEQTRLARNRRLTEVTSETLGDSGDWTRVDATSQRNLRSQTMDWKLHVRILTKIEALTLLSADVRLISRFRYFVQSLCKEPSSREEAIALGNHIDNLLTSRRAKQSGICSIRREIFSELFDEVKVLTIFSNKTYKSSFVSASASSVDRKPSLGQTAVENQKRNQYDLGGLRRSVF